MALVSVISGIVVEVRRYASTALFTACSPSAERRELWILTDGKQVQFVIQSASFPARVGQHVDVLVVEEAVVGIYNKSTGRAMNYVRQNPPQLVRGWEWGTMLVASSALIASAILGGRWGAAALAGLIGLHLIVAIPERKHAMSVLRQAVDEVLLQQERRLLQATPSDRR